MLSAMLGIGTFSTATHVSIPTLRRYHEMGVLVPAEVDPVTGYRSYRREQIGAAQLIRRLRDLDLSWTSVGLVLSARNPTLATELLTGHRLVLADRRARLDRMLVDLAGLLEDSRPLDVGPVHVRVQEPEPVLVIRGRTPERNFSSYFGRAFARLGAHAARHRLTVTGPGGAWFPGRQWDGEDVEVETFLPVGEPTTGDRSERHDYQRAGGRLGARGGLRRPRRCPRRTRRLARVPGDRAVGQPAGALSGQPGRRCRSHGLAYRGGLAAEHRDDR